MGALNGGGFARYKDWRVPNVYELESLRNFGASFPTAYPACDNSCTSGCTATTCSCTRSNFHWSSSTHQLNDNRAWLVDFYDGFND